MKGVEVLLRTLAESGPSKLFADGRCRRRVQGNETIRENVESERLERMVCVDVFVVDRTVWYQGSSGATGTRSRSTEDFDPPSGKSRSTAETVEASIGACRCGL